MNTKDRLVSLICDRLCIEVTNNVDELNSHINSMDSLDMTDMVFHIEEKFGIRFEDRFVFENFEKLCDHLDKKLVDIS